MKQNLVYAIPIALVLVVLLSGCTIPGLTQPPAQPPAAQPNEPTPEPAQPPAAEPAAPPAEEPAPEAPPAEPPAEEPAPETPAEEPVATADLAAFLTGRTTEGYKVVYNVSAVFSEGTYTGDITHYMKLPNLRVDTGSGNVETRSFFNLDARTGKVCYYIMQSWNCQTADVPAGSYDVESGSSDYAITADGTTTAAGETGTCFKAVSKKEANQTARLCYTQDGILVFYNVTDGQNTTEMTATAVTRGVADTEFVAPA